MKLLTTTFFIIVFSFQFLTVSAQVCASASNIYTFTYRAKKYEIVKEKKSWVDAAACAVLRGGYLVQINSKPEQDSLFNQIKNNSGIASNYTSVGDGGGAAYVWIGATDKKTEGNWLWDGNNDDTGANFWNGQGSVGVGGGVSFGYVNWGGMSTGAPKEPDNYLSNQNAAGICLGSWPYGIAGEWNDISSANTLYYVIEYDSSASSGFNNLLLPSNDVCIYPNPANHQLNITSNQTEIITSVAVINQLGSIVKKENTSNKSKILFDVSDIESGIYFVNIDFASGTTITKKVVLNR
ncbi:MAG: T9SS type A sorting domain-containing protein [Bacteroidota bacterium]